MLRHNVSDLKFDLRRAKIRLWQLSSILGISIDLISKYLNRQTPMPDEIEEKIKKIISSGVPEELKR